MSRFIMFTLKDSKHSKLLSFLFYSAVRDGDTFCSAKKYPKKRRRVVQSAFCKKNFLENLAVVICELIALTPKNAHQQREMIWAFLQCFLQKLFQQTAIHHFTAYIT